MRLDGSMRTFDLVPMLRQLMRETLMTQQPGLT
jgi:hypothetical protein